MSRGIVLKPLGIIMMNGKLVNHRSLRKILLNPILRVFGVCLASNFDGYNFTSYSIINCDKQLNVFKNYYSSIFTCNTYNKVIRMKMF